ncbi:hypothetical protein MAMC_02099 [Methylacidimicrobium cyclopophantes]|uniref:Uncharacterized protein n=1 Tax=Methylacidimicrobium cyclopophantes TaxID=1041766 RepID=A0A5E6MFY6_9BACT|nr:hypothetical protein MAMC_02099 [Methylacidimicrobium cyclopophantes]
MKPVDRCRALRALGGPERLRQSHQGQGRRHSMKYWKQCVELCGVPGEEPNPEPPFGGELDQTDRWKERSTFGSFSGKPRLPIRFRAWR